MFPLLSLRRLQDRKASVRHARTDEDETLRTRCERETQRDISPGCRRHATGCPRIAARRSDVYLPHANRTLVPCATCAPAAQRPPAATQSPSVALSNESMQVKHVMWSQHIVQHGGLQQQVTTCTVLGMAHHPTGSAIVFSGTFGGWFELHAGRWMGVYRNLWFKGGGGGVQGSPLTLGSILVFFRLRHFSAHRSQFGCVIPDLGKNRNPFNCRVSSMKSGAEVPGAEIRVLRREACFNQNYIFLS